MIRKVLISFVLFTHVFIGLAVAPSDTITLHLDRVSIEHVLSRIEVCTEYYFLYNSKLVNVDRKVNLHVDRLTIQQVLNTLFKDSEIEYAIRNKQIILNHNKEAIFQFTEYSTINGTIKDRYGSPVVGATIRSQMTNTGTISGLDGHFTLLVPIGSALNISYIGYTPQTVIIQSISSLIIVLSESIHRLNELVVIGYGTQLSEEVTSAVTRIRTPHFNKTPSIYPAGLLKGRVAGLSVSKYNDDPNIAYGIQIRGVTSIKGSNEPLIVIDGIPGDMRSLNAIPPEEVEAIDVLKDGSAAAIYGTRGNNGVIIVSTKEAKTDGFNLEYTGYLSTDIIVGKPKILSAEDFLQYGKQSDNPVIRDFSSRENAYDLLLNKNNFSQVHNIAVTGNSHQVNYRASLNYRNNEGVVIKSARKAINASLAIKHLSLNDKLQLSFRLVNTQNQSDYMNEETDYGVFFEAMRRNPTLPVYLSNGSFYENYSGYEDFNPVAHLDQQDREGKYTNTLGSFNATAQLSSYLSTSLFIALVKNENYLNYYRSRLAYRSVKSGDKGEANKKYLQQVNKTAEWTTTYNRYFNRHHVTGLFGYSYQDFDEEWFEAGNRGFLTDVFQSNNIGVGDYLKEGKATMGSYKGSSRLIAFFARANYDFSGKYLVNASIRQEGSSKFGVNNKWALFPAFGIGWMINRESFLQDITAVDLLKIRFGFGVTGSLPNDPYMSLIKYGTGAGAWDALNNRWIPATYGPTNNPNPKLKWERNMSQNLGIDFAFLDSRLSGSLDAYLITTKDLIGEYTAQQPSHVYNSLLTNVGTMRNTGIELSITAEVVKREQFGYTLNFIASFEKNKLTSLSNELYKSTYEDRYQFPSPGNIGFAQRMQEGQPVGSFFGYICDGISPEGKWNIRDLDGKEGLSESDKTFIGNGLPEIKTSLLNTFTFKKFEFSFLLTGMFGFDVLNESRIFLGTTSSIDKTGTNVMQDALNHKLTEDPIFSTFYLEKGDFIRVDNATLGYRFTNNKSGLLKQFFVYFNVDNLITFTDYSGHMPDMNVIGLEAGINKRGVYPITRAFTCGVNITF